MIELMLHGLTVITLIIIAICQLKQAFNPVSYLDYNVEEAGVEVPIEAEISKDSPVYKMMVEAYQKANSFSRPTEYVQQMIEDDTGVEFITEKEESELYNGR